MLDIQRVTYLGISSDIFFAHLDISQRYLYRYLEKISIADISNLL
jgi:hypothetical protein